MNKVIFVSLAILAFCNGQKSYENYKVFRVDVPSQETFDLLSSFSDIHFWNEGRVGSHADVMVASGRFGVDGVDHIKLPRDEGDGR